jgi:hypothetical protein
MAIKDSVITLKGDQAAVRRLEIVVMDPKTGDYTFVVHGATKDANGQEIMLQASSSATAATPELAQVWAYGLSVLRKANSLE